MHKQTRAAHTRVVQGPAARGTDGTRALLYLRVGGHDRVVPVIVQGGGRGVERAGPIEVSLDAVVIVLCRDLLSVFKPVDL